MERERKRETEEERDRGKRGKGGGREEKATIHKLLLFNLDLIWATPCSVHGVTPRGILWTVQYQRLKIGPTAVKHVLSPLSDLLVPSLFLTFDILCFWFCLGTCLVFGASFLILIPFHLISFD